MVKKAGEGGEHVVLQYMECMPPSDEANEALKCACLQWAAADSDAEGTDVRAERRERDAVAACERLGAVPFRSTVSIVDAVWAVMGYIRSTA